MSGQNKVRSFLLSFNDEDKYVALRDEFKKLKQMDYFIAGKDDNGILIYCHFKDKYRLSKKILSYGVKNVQWEKSPSACSKFVKSKPIILDEFGDKPHQGHSIEKTVEDKHTGGLTDEEIIEGGKQLFKEFYNIPDDKLQEALENYQGFCIETETEAL